jgi:purine-binding chemotaxis protein CheW
MKDRKKKREGSVDWTEVRRRIERTREAIDKGWFPDEAEKKRILKTRARRHAIEPERPAPAEQMEVVEFLLANERYGFESQFVREAYPLRGYAPVPCTPPFVLGIINVRGEILSIIDIRKFFDLPDSGPGELNRVVVLFSDVVEFGVLADAILGVRNVSLEELVTPPATFAGLRREYLKGITGDGVAVLDAGKILSDPRIIVNEFV